MQIFQYILLGFLIVCAISVSFSKSLLNSTLIYMSYSLIMSDHLDPAGIPGSCNHRGGCGSGRHQSFVFCDIEENPRDGRGGR